MAIEAAGNPNPNPNPTFFPNSHFITITNPRDLWMMNQNQNQIVVGGTSFPAVPLPSTAHFPIPNVLPLSAPTIPPYAKEAADSGLTSNNMASLPSSRKRSRDDFYPFLDHSTPVSFAPSQRIKSMTSSWFEQEPALQMQRELDSLIAQHTQRLRAELGERARQHAKALAFAIQGAVATKLREKDEEIQRVAKLNLGLQERVRSMCAENQLWRGLAQSNEAAVNSLRTDLERVLTGTTGGGVVDNNGNIPGAARGNEEEEGDAESCCGSNEEEDEMVIGRGMRRRCRACEGWLEDTSEGVVVMPCRHVFMQCKRCNCSNRQSCPVCGSQITATLHVHLPN